MIHLRGSYAPIALTCAQAIRGEGENDSNFPKIDSVTDANKLGTFVHKIVANYLDTADTKSFWNEVSAGGYDKKELSWLFYTAINMWDGESGLNIAHQGRFETELELEYTLDDKIHFTGHTDVISHNPNGKVIIDDWKTGRIHYDHTYQLLTYALLAYENYTDVGQIKVRTIWLRDEYPEEIVYLPGDIENFKKYALDHLLQENPPYVTGNCTFCKRKASCPAYEEPVKQLTRVLTGNEAWSFSGSIKELAESGRLHEALNAIRELGKMIDDFKDAVKLYVEQVGAVPAGPGKEIRILDRNVKHIAAKKAWKYLVEKYGEDNLLSAVKLTKGKLEALAEQEAPKGKKAAFKRELIDDLFDLNAIHVETQQTVREVNAR